MIENKTVIWTLVLLVAAVSMKSSSAFGSETATVDAIKEVKKIEVEDAAFDGKREADKPILIKDEKTAKKYFGEKALEKLMESVDFEEQHVLVFAWKGSGQDKLTFEVMESWPEQIRFKLTRGRTRDLRSHVRVFAIRSNVKLRTPLKK